MYTVVWAVKKNVHIDNRENESKIYGEDDYGKPKNQMVQSGLETSRLEEQAGKNVGRKTDDFSSLDIYKKVNNVGKKRIIFLQKTILQTTGWTSN